MTKRPEDDRPTAQQPDSTKREAPMSDRTTARKHDRTKGEARIPDSPKDEDSDSAPEVPPTHESTGREAPMHNRTKRETSIPDSLTAQPHESTTIPDSLKARPHESTKREARMPDRTTARRPDSTRREAPMPEKENTIHEQVLIVGKLTVLVGVLIAVGLSSAYLGMRLAVRGTEVEVPSIVGKPVG